MTALHPRLQKDCLLVGCFPLCRLLLMRDANYPWFILVPDRADISEIYQLEPLDQHTLIGESSLLAGALAAGFRADKLNIAALGNLVPQLHVHHVVRYRDDAAWPAPVWGKVPAKPYTDEALEATLARLAAALPEDFDYRVDGLS